MKPKYPTIVIEGTPIEGPLDISQLGSAGAYIVAAALERHVYRWWGEAFALSLAAVAAQQLCDFQTLRGATGAAHTDGHWLRACNYCYRVERYTWEGIGEALPHGLEHEPNCDVLTIRRRLGYV